MKAADRIISSVSEDVKNTLHCICMFFSIREDSKGLRCARLLQCALVVLSRLLSQGRDIYTETVGAG